MPDPARRQAQERSVDRSADSAASTVVRETGGADITPPVKPEARLKRGKPERRASARDLEALGIGWEQLNAGDFPTALASFGRAAVSADKLIAQEAELGKAYALWRQGRETLAEAAFRKLVDQGFRVPEVLPNLLFLLHKRGGPKAVEPYLRYLPEEDRAIWRR